MEQEGGPVTTCKTAKTKTCKKATERMGEERGRERIRDYDNAEVTAVQLQLAAVSTKGDGAWARTGSCPCYHAKRGSGTEAKRGQLHAQPADTLFLKLDRQWCFISCGHYCLKIILWYCLALWAQHRSTFSARLIPAIIPSRETIRCFSASHWGSDTA